MSDRGEALVEAALIMPVVLLVLVGGLVLGVAIVDDMRLERATADAARLDESEARQLVRTVGGRITCYSTTGECFDDGMTVDRVQVVAEGHGWLLPTGRLVTTARAVRPVEGE